MYIRGTLQVTGTVPQTVPRPAGFYLIWSLHKRYLSRLSAMSQFEHVYCTIATVTSRILKICWPRWPINFLLSSSDLKQGLFFWPLRVTELTVKMVQYCLTTGFDFLSYALDVRLSDFGITCVGLPEQ